MNIKVGNIQNTIIILSRELYGHSSKVKVNSKASIGKYGHTDKSPDG